MHPQQDSVIIKLGGKLTDRNHDELGDSHQVLQLGEVFHFIRATLCSWPIFVQLEVVVKVMKTFFACLPGSPKNWNQTNLDVLVSNQVPLPVIETVILGDRDNYLHGPQQPSP